MNLKSTISSGMAMSETSAGLRAAGKLPASNHANERGPNSSAFTERSRLTPGSVCCPVFGTAGETAAFTGGSPNWADQAAMPTDPGDSCASFAREPVNATTALLIRIREGR